MNARRRRHLVVGAGVVATIGLGVALVAPNDDGTSLPPSSSIGSGSAPAAGSSGTDGDVPGGTDGDVPGGTDGDVPGGVGYLLDPDVAEAAGFTPVAGLSPGTGGVEPAGRVRLWATTGASRTGGTWVAIQRGAGHGTMVQDAARIAVGDVDGHAVVEPDGVVTLSVPAEGGETLLLTSFGIGPAPLADLADALRAVGPEAESATLSSRDLGDGPLRLLLDRPSTGLGLAADLLLVGVTASAFYRDAAGRLVSISSSPTDPERESVLTPFVLRGLWATGDERGVFTTGDVGMLDHPALGAMHLVSWTRDGVTIRLASTRDDLDLLSLATGARPGDEARWQAVQARSRGFVSGRGVQYADAGSGSFADGAAWSLSVADGPPWANLFVTEPDGAGAAVELYLDQRPCSSVTSTATGTTTVACLRPAGGAPSAGPELLHVGEADPVPFVDTGAGWSIAVARTDAPGALPIRWQPDGASPVTLGATGGDRSGWAIWAAADDLTRGPPADPLPTEPGYVVDGGIAGRQAVGAIRTGGSAPIGILAIWGTPSPSRTDGTWVAVAVSDASDGLPIAEGATRVRIEPEGGGGATVGASPIDALVRTSTDGVVTVEWQPSDGGQAVLVGRGLPTIRLFDIVAGVHLGHDASTGLATPLLDVAVTEEDGTPLPQLARLPTSSVAAGYVGLGDGGDRWTRYAAPGAEPDVILGVGSASLAGDLAARLLLGPLDPTDAAFDPASAGAGGAAEVLAGSVTGEPTRRVLRLRIGDDVVTVVARIPLDRIAADLAGLRGAIDGEWAELLAADAQQQASSGDDTTVLGSRVTDGGAFWSVTLQDRYGALELRGGGSVAWLAVEPSERQAIHVFRSTTTTFVVALLPAPGELTALRVAIGDDEPLLVPLTGASGGATTWVGAAYAFDAADESEVRVDLV